MKQLIKYSILIWIIILSCSGCGKKALPAPEYPLSEDALNDALKNEAFDWTVTQTSSMQDKHLMYTLSDQNDKMISILSTAKGTKDSRYLQIAFFSSPTSISALLPQEDWGDAITLAQVLYGSFQSKTQINDALNRAEDDAFVIHDTKSSSVSPSVQKIQWRETVNGIHCVVTFIRFPEDHDRVALESIVLYDSDEFIKQKGDLEFSKENP